MSKGKQISIDDAKFVLISMIYGARLEQSTEDHKKAIAERIGNEALQLVLTFALVMNSENQFEEIMNDSVGEPDSGRYKRYPQTCLILGRYLYQMDSRQPPYRK
jgi:hypothetical protein